jgi:hypothetical protein
VDPIDQLAVGIPPGEDAGSLGIVPRDVDPEALEAWLREHEPDLRHTRALRYFLALSCLDLAPEHDLLEIGGGGGLFRPIAAGRVRAHFVCDAAEIDAGFPEEHRLPGNVLSLPRGARTFDRIYLGHTFEHFRGGEDTAFVRRLGDLLAPGGVCLIEPLFLGMRHLEVFGAGEPEPVAGDPSATALVTRTSNLPGNSAERMGFARIYDPAALRARVLGPAAETGLKAEILEFRGGGEWLPDMSRYDFPRKAVNYPLRALRLTRPR